MAVANSVSYSSILDVESPPPPPPSSSSSSSSSSSLPPPLFLGCEDVTTQAGFLARVHLPGIFRHVPPFTLLLVLVYLLLNSAINLTNRYSLGIADFPFPLTLTCAHMLFSASTLGPYFFYFSERRRRKCIQVLKEEGRGVCCIGVCLALNIAFNNASLVSMTLTLNQVIRSGIPVITAAFAIAVEGKTPSPLRLFGLFPISIGVMIAVYESSQIQGSVGSIVFCLAGMFSNALMMTLSGKVMTKKIDAMQLACFTAPISLVVLLPYFFIYEGQAIYSHLHAAPLSSLAITLGTSVLALLYNIVHYKVIHVTSAVTTTVLGNIKIVMLLVLSSLLFRETSTWGFRMFLGCAVTLFGVAVYSSAGIVERPKPKAEQGKY